MRGCNKRFFLASCSSSGFSAHYLRPANKEAFHPVRNGRAFLLPCILTRCKAFILPGFNTAQYKRLQRVLPCLCNYTAHALKRHTGLYSGIPCDCTGSTAHDIRPTQAAIIPPATRWRAYTRPDAFNRYQIPPPRRDAVQVSASRLL